MEITLAELKDLLSKDTQSVIFHPGEKLFIRTVTYHLTGEVVKQNGNFLELKDAAWIADSGIFSEALKTGSLAEIEPVEGKVRVNLLSVTDIFEWRHALPRVRK